MEQDTRVCVYILIWNVHFLQKNNASVQPALAMGLGDIYTIYHGENLSNMVSLDVFILT